MYQPFCPANLWFCCPDQVGDLQKLHDEAAQQGVWVDDPHKKHEIGCTTLADVIAAGDSLLVPVCQLKRIDTAEDAPQIRLNQQSSSGTPEQKGIA